MFHDRKMFHALNKKRLKTLKKFCVQQINPHSVLMKIKFTQNIVLTVNDYNECDEYFKTFKKDEVVEIRAIENNSYGHKDIHFAYKQVAEGVDTSVFIVL